MKEKHGEYIAIYWDDNSDMEYVRGHVTLAEARAALEFGCGKGCGDFAHTVTHRWARWQPAPRSSDFDSLFVTRPTLMNYTAKRTDLEMLGTELFDIVVSGKVRIEVNQTCALKDVAQAHRDLEARKTTGSTVLLP